jgi:hypothetical protein
MYLLLRLTLLDTSSYSLDISVGSGFVEIVSWTAAGCILEGTPRVFKSLKWCVLALFVDTLEKGALSQLFVMTWRKVGHHCSSKRARRLMNWMLSGSLLFHKLLFFAGYIDLFLLSRLLSIVRKEFNLTLVTARHRVLIYNWPMISGIWQVVADQRVLYSRVLPYWFPAKVSLEVGQVEIPFLNYLNLGDILI